MLTIPYTTVYCPPMTILITSVLYHKWICLSIEKNAADQIYLQKPSHRTALRTKEVFLLQDAVERRYQMCYANADLGKYTITMELMK